MFTKIKQWYIKWQFNSLCKRIISADISMKLLLDLTLWVGSVSKHINDDDLYQLRFNSNFINILELVDAIEIMGNNLANDKGNDFKTTKRNNILLDDWLVTAQSYRYSLKEFELYSKKDLELIIRQLGIVHRSDVDFYLSNYMPILVTLQNLVEVCYRRK